MHVFVAPSGDQHAVVGSSLTVSSTLHVVQWRERFLQPGVSSEADAGRRAERILEPSINPTFLNGADICNRVDTGGRSGRVALSHGHGCLST